MFVRSLGIRDIAEIEQISIKKVLSVLTNSAKLLNQPFFTSILAIFKSILFTIPSKFKPYRKAITYNVMALLLKLKYV
jgi:hypothetical protein